VARLAAQDELLREMAEALKPFTDFASATGFGALPENMEMTRGSRFAKRQVTVGDFRRARAALAKYDAMKEGRG
jgi:hypothetical protein